MGIVDLHIWKCKACNYVFKGQSGLYETSPMFYETTHFISPYYCPKCNNLKNISTNAKFFNHIPEEFQDICHTDSEICELCGTKMKLLKRPKIKFLQMNRICPNCGKKQLRFVEYKECYYMT